MHRRSKGTCFNFGGQDARHLAPLPPLGGDLFLHFQQTPRFIFGGLRLRANSVGRAGFTLCSCCNVRVSLALRFAAPICVEGLFEAMLARRSGLDPGSPRPDFGDSGPAQGAEIINPSNSERR